MDPIDAVQPGNETTKEKTMHNVDIDEEDAIRKVEEANMPSQSAQEGVREVEAVTLSWTKTSLACAFIWYVQHPLQQIHLLIFSSACGSST
jgi:hypothetical protein